MAYRLKGTYYAPCSCEVACPCDFGSLEGDDGWCSGVLAVAIDEGEIDGVDVGGVTVAGAVDWPKGFLSGEGTGRLYFDPSTTSEQREALQRAFSGAAGGDLEALGGLISEWLEPREAEVRLERSDERTTISVAGFGTAVIEPLRNEAGQVTTVLAMPAAFAAETVFGRGDGTSWQDPDLKRWESRGHAEMGAIEWAG